MAYYAAVCLYADTRNNNFDSNLAGEDFFDTYESDHFQDLFPTCFLEQEVRFRNDAHQDVWHDEFTAALLWNIWHSSPYSGEQTIAYLSDRSGIYCHEPLTIEDAVCAVTRLADSFDPHVESPYISSDSDQARTPGGWILSGDLLSQAAETPVKRMTELPRLTGCLRVLPPVNRAC